MTPPHPRPIAAVLGLIVASAVLAFGVDGVRGVDEKIPEPDPWAGLTDGEKQAFVDAAHAANDRFLADFVANKRDPRTLPRIVTEAYSGPEAGSLAEAATRAELILRGRVADVTFERSPTDGMPRATSTIDVTSVIAGDAPGVVKIFQEGRPVAQGDGGGLVQDDVDPILMPGDSVILLLTYDAKLDTYRTLAGVGVNVIEVDGTVRAQEANPFGDEVTGLKAADFVRKIEAAAR